MTAAAAEARLTVDLDAIAANYHCIAKAARGAEVAPAVKADGYGLGAGPVAKRLWTEGARSFFVARLSEGEALRHALGDRTAAIFVLDGCLGGPERLSAATLTPVLNDLAELESWALHARRTGAPLPCALHVDTGFNRLGLRAEEVEALVAAPDQLDALNVRLLMSHLACATDPEHPMSAKQVGRFRKLTHLFPDARKSLANTAGVFLGEDYLFEMVRPGIGLYGGGPFGKPEARLRAVATFEAPMLQIRTVRRRESVGYGAAWTAERPTRIAIVGAGYADGVLRSQVRMAMPGSRVAAGPCWGGYPWT